MLWNECTFGEMVERGLSCTNTLHLNYNVQLCICVQLCLVSAASFCDKDPAVPIKELELLFSPTTLPWEAPKKQNN